MIPSNSGRCPLLVLGLGNLLCSDDGAGPIVIDRLKAGWQPAAGVRVLDGGTLGLSLLPLLADADRVLLVDSVMVRSATPGTLVRLTGEEVPQAARQHLSVHQVGVADLLDGLHLLDQVPRTLVLHGVVPASLELEIGCTPAVDAALDELLANVLAETAALGFPFRAHEVEDATPSPDHREVARSRSGVGCGL